MNESQLQSEGIEVIHCFPDSYRPIWAEEAHEDEPSEADRQAWEDYNLGAKAGNGFGVVQFASEELWSAAIVLEPRLKDFTTILNPDATIAIWVRSDLASCGIKDWQAQLITSRFITPAPGSSVGTQEATILKSTTPLLRPLFDDIPAHLPLTSRPVPMQAIPLRGYMSFAPPEEPPMMENGILDMRSKMVLAGPPKIGKSRVALNLAFSLALGQPFMGYAVYKMSRVLFLQFEISERRFRQRVNGIARALKIPTDNNVPLYLQTLPYLALDSASGGWLLRRYIRALSADVVILDPMVKLHTGDEKEQSDMQGLLNNLDDIIEDTGVSIVLVHHTRKPAGGVKSSGGEAWASIRGSSYIPAWTDSNLIMGRPTPGATPVIQGVLRNGEDFTRAIKFGNNHLMEVIGDLKAAIDLSIKDMFMEEPGLGRKALATKVAKLWAADMTDVWMAMKRVEDSGFSLPK